MRILFVSHTFIGGSFVVGSHHLAREFNKIGWDVYHLSTPISPFHKLSRNKKNVKLKRSIWKNNNKEIKQTDGVRNIVPYTILPWHISKYFFCIFGINLTVLFMNICRNFPKEFDIIIIDQPSLVGIENFLRYKQIIYRPTDIYHAMNNDRIIVKAEKEIISKSKCVICTSKPVAEHIRELDDVKPITVIENGVEVDHFKVKRSKPEYFNNIKTKILTYVGSLDDRFDFTLIRDFAKIRPIYNIVIIGPITEEAKNFLGGINNIHLIGEVNYSDIPCYLQHSDIGLLPLSDNPSNNGRSPMKLYEYLSCGIPAVVRETTELRSRELKNVYLYNNMDEFSYVIDNLIKSETKKIVNTEKYSWKNIAQEIKKIIEKK